MEWVTRKKPTRHVQVCSVCKKNMEKDALQTIEKRWDQMGYEYRSYFCPSCAITFTLSHNSWQEWFEHSYGELTLDNFMEAYKNRTWLSSYNDHKAPFLILASHHLSPKEERKMMKEMLLLMVFNKAMIPEEEEW